MKLLETWKMVDGTFDPLDSNDDRLTLSREKFVCVEPGHVRGNVTLPIGALWVGRQVLRYGW